MKNKTPFSIKSRLNSFVYAIEGLRTLFRSEHNSWIHAVAAMLAITMGFLLDINNTEWCIILFAIGFVIVAEIINTAIETLTDIVSPEYHQKAKEVKDLAAAGVLIASITALIAGIIVFAKKLL
jgi:diacylglycerol kinase